MFWFVAGIVLAIIVAVVIYAVRKYNSEQRPFKGMQWALLALLLCGISFVGTVPTGYTGIVTTFGNVEEYTLEAGLHPKLFYQEIVNMDNRTQKQTRVDACFSSDIQQVNVTYSVNYNIDKLTAMNLYQNVGTGYFETIVVPRTLEDLKAVFSKYSADQLVSKRESLSVQVEELLRADMSPYGINIVNVNIEDVDFTDAYTDAVEQKQVAAQNKLKAETEQAQKTMETNAAAERQVIDANAKAEQDRIDADAQLYVKEQEAKANEKLAASITAPLIQYLQAQKWSGELPTYMGGAGSTTIPILDLEEDAAQ